MDPHHANLQPNLLLLGSRFHFNQTPSFLGVAFDRTLSFSKLVSSLKAKFFPRLKTLRCISASFWGPSKESLSLLYKAYFRPVLTYASPGWFPFLSVTSITKLECLHRAANGAISSSLSSCCCCCCCLPDPFRGMGAWRKTIEPHKPSNSPGSGPEVVERQRVAKE